eukprot:Skav229020  [mRNA]  locus=scaffold127:518727:523047:- [translate_table: standard]
MSTSNGRGETVALQALQDTAPLAELPLALVPAPALEDGEEDEPDQDEAEPPPSTMEAAEVQGLEAPEAWPGRAYLTTVGLSSVPTWYRANLALALQQRESSSRETPAVFDEWTSELDRDLAKVVSAAFAKRMRREATKPKATDFFPREASAGCDKGGLEEVLEKLMGDEGYVNAEDAEMEHEGGRKEGEEKAEEKEEEKEGEEHPHEEDTLAKDSGR